MSLRRVLQLHTALLAGASLALLCVPLPALAGLGVAEPDFLVLSLTRIAAAVRDARPRLQPGR